MEVTATIDENVSTLTKKRLVLKKPQFFCFSISSLTNYNTQVFNLKIPFRDRVLRVIKV